MGYEVKLINESHEFEKLHNKWKELNSKLNDGIFFLNYVWCKEWWYTYSKRNDRLYIITIFKSQELVAICPLYLQDSVSGNILRFIGTGEPEYAEVSSEFLDILCLDEYKKDVVNEVFNYILKNSKCFQCIIFNKVLDDSIVLMLSKLLSKTFFLKKSIPGIRYYIQISSLTWHEYIKSIPSKNFKYKIKKINKLFSKHPDANYRVVSDIEELNKLYTELINLHQNSWKNKGKLGAFHTNKFIQFHRKIIEHSQKYKNVRFLAIEIDGSLVAIFYFITHGDWCHYYQSGINRKFEPKVSPGVLGHLMMMQYCIDHGYKYYDFMMGDEFNSYKSRFNPSTQIMYDIELERRNFHGTFIKLKWLLQSYKQYIKKQLNS